MIVACITNTRVVFFNRSNSMPRNYDFQSVTCPYPHRLFYGNDTLFYLTSIPIRMRDPSGRECS